MSKKQAKPAGKPAKPATKQASKPAAKAASAAKEPTGKIAKKLAKKDAKAAAKAKAAKKAAQFRAIEDRIRKFWDSSADTGVYVVPEDTDTDTDGEPEVSCLEALLVIEKDALSMLATAREQIAALRRPETTLSDIDAMCRRQYDRMSSGDLGTLH